MSGAIYGSKAINKVCAREIKKHFASQTNRVIFFSKATLKWIRGIERYMPKFKLIDDLNKLLNSAEKAIELLQGIPNETTLKQAYWKARVSGVCVFILGLGVLIDVGRRAWLGSAPESSMIITIACISLVVNGVVLFLLRRFRKGEVINKYNYFLLLEVCRLLGFHLCRLLFLHPQNTLYL